MQIYPSITFLIFLCIFDYLYIDVNSFYINQAVGGTGTLLCHGKPRYNAEVYLYDYDRFGKDDQLSNVHTDKKGYFLIQGYETEFLPVFIDLN
uniref:Uncharacterized protein n=1 Tax=Parastrongyloides trichosuri TaxID=131310 RepID=A0A0N5A2Q9_PARTI